MDPVIENRDLGRQGAVQYLDLVPAGADVWWRVAGSGGRWPVLWCLVLPCRRWRAAACQGPSPGRAGAEAGTRRRRRRPSGVGALGNCNLGEKTACLWASRELASRVVGMCCVWASKWAGPEIGKLKKNWAEPRAMAGPGCASTPDQNNAITRDFFYVKEVCSFSKTHKHFS